MPAAVRLGDVCTGHDLCEARPNIGASSDVFINKLGAHRVGDPWAWHCNHTSAQGSGSNNVFVNRLSIARVGDAVVCGSANASGSDNVFVNGGINRFPVVVPEVITPTTTLLYPDALRTEDGELIYTEEGTLRTIE